MAKEVFLISDMHFGHEKFYREPFLTASGDRVRPFDSAEQADEHMVQQWNLMVRPGDKVYVLGDVAIPRKGVKTMGRLNGDKVLIAGNHDSMYMKDLAEHFRSIRAYWKLDNLILSHVPIHPGSLRTFDGNVHGHLHSGDVVDAEGHPDLRYFSVCVEKINYTPINFEEVRSYFRSLSGIL